MKKFIIFILFLISPLLLFSQQNLTNYSFNFSGSEIEFDKNSLISSQGQAVIGRSRQEIQ